MKGTAHKYNGCRNFGFGTRCCFCSEKFSLIAKNTRLFLHTLLFSIFAFFVTIYDNL